MLSPSVLNRMRRDFNLLLNGLDGSDAILTWANPDIGAVIDPVYNEVSGGVVTGSITTRCHVNKIYGEGEIKHKNLVDVMSGDAIILFDKSVDFSGKDNLVVTITNFGTWKPVEQPPNVFQSYTHILVSNDLLVQAIYMRRYST